jgi:hypothetical protein
MNARPRSALASVLLVVAAGSWTGCGDRSDDSGGSELTGRTARDKAIAARLATYIDRNYPNGQRPLRPAEDLSPSERRAFAELADNIAELNQSIKRISVRNAVITVHTKLAPDTEGIQTARLICTVIYGADVADFTRGHEVRGLNGRALVKCSPNTNPLR